MSEHQRETEFLRHLIGYGDTEERRELDKKLAQLQRDQRCVERAASWAVLGTALAVALLAYPAILQENFPHTPYESVIKVICVLGLASLICLVCFVGLLMVYRNKLNRLQEEGRQLIKKLLALRLGQPHIVTGQRSPEGSADGEDAPGAAELRDSGNGPLSLRDLVADGEDGIIQQGDSCP
jgi:hypothetical protein